MSEATDLVDRQVAAYQARDLDSFLSFYAEDVKVRDLDGTVIAVGLDGMRAFYEPLFRDSPQLSAKILNRIAIRNHVIDEEGVSGINLAGYPAEMHAAVVYQIRDGLIHDVIFIM
jgi:uncharacterized protein (TIGR02246 family)